MDMCTNLWTDGQNKHMVGWIQEGVLKEEVLPQVSGLCLVMKLTETTVNNTIIKQNLKQCRCFTSYYIQVTLLVFIA